jgi:type II secretory pathway component GspD/PulD (secretin)
MRSVLVGLAGLLAASPVLAGPRDAGCKKPSEKALVKVNLKPDTEIADLLNWYSNLTCTPIMSSTGAPLAGKKVTIIAPKPITVAEARRLFHDALGSVGLAAEQNGRFLQIISAARARSSNTPLYRTPRSAER